MFTRKAKQFSAALLLAAMSVATVLPARAQAPAAMPPAAGAAAALLPGAEPFVPSGTVVRRVVMKDALSAEQFKIRLDTMKATNMFRDTIPGPDPKKPVVIEISFLVSGNYLLVVGSKEWVDAHIETIRLMAYLYERPRAHLQLNLRVVQLTGPANANVIQMSETVRALVDGQRDEVVRTFSDLGEYLTGRAQARTGQEAQVLNTARQLLPTLGTGERPLTVPEILLLLMLDRASPQPMSMPTGEREGAVDIDGAYMELPRALERMVNNPRGGANGLQPVSEQLSNWKKVVSLARDWTAHYAEELKKGKQGGGAAAFKQAIDSPDCPLPSWLCRRMLRSMDMTERLYPNLVRKHSEASLRALQERFQDALDREAKIEEALTKQEKAPMKERKVLTEEESEDAGETKADSKKKKTEAKPLPIDATGHNLVALKTLTEELVPAPMALFDSVANTSDNAAPTPQQVITMFREYATERRKLDERLGAENVSAKSTINYAKLQSLEASLNLWLRRVSEAMARALDAQIYRRYVNELRLLANKQLGKSSNRDLLDEVSIDQVPDVTRDFLLADTGVNIFVSNSIGMQFSPDTTNSVSAQVQSQLPSKLNTIERLQQANQAHSLVGALSTAYGIDGAAIVKSLLSGGQSVPVQAGITLSATPSVGFDAGTVSLSLTANQTLQPNTDKVADRVTNHSINNATITAISYEPMVLSTLASNISYYENGGGIPLLRKVPGVKSLLKDLPIAPFKETKRQKGVYQSSVLILEPVVIPTIEDLVRYHSGWREGLPLVTPDEDEAPAKPAAPAPMVPAAAPMMPATPPAAPAKP